MHGAEVQGSGVKEEGQIPKGDTAVSHTVVSQEYGRLAGLAQGLAQLRAYADCVEEREQARERMGQIGEAQETMADRVFTALTKGNRHRDWVKVMMA